MNEEHIESWSRRLLEVGPGDRVVQTDDAGVVHERVVKYEPWQLGDGTWVIGLKGISGGYALSRCQPAQAEGVVEP